MKIRPSINLRRRWLLLLTAALAVVAGGGAVIAIVVLFTKPATSEPGSPVARFDILTPLPFYGYGTVVPPDTSNPTHCQAPADERPAPDLPLLPCHYSGAEPPPGAIPTPAPGKAPSPQNAAAGWQVVDNPMFRFTLAIPPGWYANMRPEGGEFYVLDPVALQEETNGEHPPGGVMMHFMANAYSPVDESTLPPEMVPVVQRHLDAPNTSFGGYAGAVWEEPAGGEGLARIIHAAFLKDGVVFIVLANVEDDRSNAEVDADAATVRQILATITPY